MSKVFTMAALQSRSDQELRALFRKAHDDLARSSEGSAERCNALATMENINRTLNQRRLQPRPPGF
jgi:hypothetical protein